MKNRLLLLVAILTVVFGSMYALVHVMNRSLAFDMPQLLATQATKQLEAGLGPESIAMGRTDLANNPVPFVMVYDKKSKPLAGSGYVDSKLAQMPAGVINHASKDKLHAVEWAPKENVHIASVTAYSPKTGYYVVGGQSLQTTEARSKRLLLLTLAGYLLSLVVLTIWELFVRRDRFALPSYPERKKDAKVEELSSRALPRKTVKTGSTKNPKKKTK